LTSTDR